MPSPPQAAIDAVLSESTRVVRRVDIYEQDGVTPFMLNAPLEDGNISVDGAREERRMLDLMLLNEDGALDNYPEGLWYDKVIKPYRGVEWTGTTESRLRFSGGAAGAPEPTDWDGDPIDWDGEPVTWGFGAGTPNSYIRTASSPSHDMFGNLLSLEIGLTMDDWTPASEQVFLAVWDDAANEKSFKFSILPSGTLRIGISTDGTNELFLDSALPLSFSDGTEWYIKMDLDIDNGAGGKTAHFYVGLDGTSWLPLDGPVTSATLGTAAYYGGNTSLTIGADGDGNYLHGNLRKVKLLDDDRVMVDLTFDSLASDTHALIDNSTGTAYQILGDTWVILGGALTTMTWEQQLGEFLIDKAEDQDFPLGVSIQGRDFTKKLIDDEFTWPTAFSAGQSIEDVIHIIANNGGITKQILPVTGHALGKQYLFEAQTSRWKAITSIATAFGYEVYFNEAGFMVMREHRDPVTSPVIFTFETGERGSLARIKKSSSDTRIHNRVVVRKESSDRLPLTVVAENHEPSSPTSIENLGRTKTYNYTSAFFTDIAQMQTVARQLLAIHSLESYDLNLESLVIFWLEANDIMEFVDPRPAPGDPTRYLLSNFTIPLGLKTMTTVAKRVTVVG